MVEGRVPGDGLGSSLVGRTSSSGKHDCDHQRAIEVGVDGEGDGGVGGLARPSPGLYTFLHPYVKSSANARECPTSKLGLYVTACIVPMRVLEMCRYFCMP